LDPKSKIKAMKKIFSLGVACILLIAIACSGEDGNIVISPEGNIGNEVTDTTEIMGTNKIILKIGASVLTATLVDNSSTIALTEVLKEGPITVAMQDYGNMEKVGDLGRSFPVNDKQITTEPGDIILYQGRALVIYYAPNSWSFTRLGKIDSLSATELKNVLGDGNVTVTLSLP